MFNAFNRVNFNNPNTNIQSGSFGLVTTAGVWALHAVRPSTGLLMVRNGLLFLVCAATAASQGNEAGGRHTAAERYKMFQNHLAVRANAITDNQFRGITNLEDWQKKRTEIRRQLLDSFGLDPLPPRTPLNARITGSFEGEGYRVEKIAFESQPRLYVTGNLYLPRAGARNRPPSCT